MEILTAFLLCLGAYHEHPAAPKRAIIRNQYITLSFKFVYTIFFSPKSFERDEFKCRMIVHTLSKTFTPTYNKPKKSTRAVHCCCSTRVLTSFTHRMSTEALPLPNPRLAKRTKNAAQGYDFRVTVSSTHALKNLIDIVSNILTEAVFLVQVNDQFQGLRLDAIDAGHVCMIKARFQCQVEFPRDKTGSEEFCVNVKMLMTFLKRAASSSVLELLRKEGDSNLILRVTDVEDFSEYIIPTVNQSQDEDLGMFDINAQHSVQIDLTKFKNFCKMAAEIQATSVYLEIKDTEKGSDRVFSLGCKSERGEATKHFHSSNVKSGETLPGQKHTSDVIVCGKSRGFKDEDLQNFRTVYKHDYATKYLVQFLKSMEKNTLYLALAPEYPMVMHYNLGTEHSHVRMIIAAQVDDEDC